VIGRATWFVSWLISLGCPDSRFPNPKEKASNAACLVKCRLKP
jgi:hypothetical protein